MNASAPIASNPVRKFLPWQAALSLGLVAGFGAACLWPAEPVRAQAGGEKFTVFTVQVEVAAVIGGLGTAGNDAIFVLDHLTGRLIGNVLDQATGKFTLGYERNIAGDFPINPADTPVFTVVSGSANLNAGGRVRNAPGVIYIAELTSGVCNCYSLPFTATNRRGGVLPINPLDQFVFKQAI